MRQYQRGGVEQERKIFSTGPVGRRRVTLRLRSQGAAKCQETVIYGVTDWVRGNM